MNVVKKAKKLKKGKNQHVLGWTVRELNYIKNNIGYIPLEDIALALGRTLAAVESKMEKSGIGIQSVQKDRDSVSLNQLGKILRIDSKAIKRWMIKYDFPAVELKLKKTTKKGSYYVSIKDFWKWANKNRTVVNWHKIERQVLLPEPRWLDEILRTPEAIKQKRWTKQEDVMIWSMYYHEGMRIKEIAKKRERTKNSIEHRLKILRENGFGEEMRCHAVKYFQIHGSPAREEGTTLKKWSYEEEELAIWLFYQKGFSHKAIAYILGDRTENAIERKLSQLRKKGRVSEEYLQVNRPRKIWSDEEINKIDVTYFMNMFSGTNASLPQSI